MSEPKTPPEPDKIQTLLDDYNDDVMALSRTPSTSPKIPTYFLFNIITF